LFLSLAAAILNVQSPKVTSRVGRTVGVSGCRAKGIEGRIDWEVVLARMMNAIDGKEQSGQVAWSCVKAREAGERQDRQLDCIHSFAQS